MFSLNAAPVIAFAGVIWIDVSFLFRYFYPCVLVAASECGCSENVSTTNTCYTFKEALLKDKNDCVNHLIFW